MWCYNDKRDFQAFNSHGAGQISPEGAVGHMLIDLVKSNAFNTIVDIGTWNGLGSTKCFLLGLRGNKTTKFISIESNKEKHVIAFNNLASLLTENSALLHGSILTDADVTESAVLSVFPEFNSNSEFRRWHSIDVENIRQSPFLLNDIPDTIDLILFDGGEFTTFFEFQRLFSRCKNFIALDDVNGSKCQKIRNFLSMHPDWTEVSYINERNGFSLFKHK
jgi:hypothetical protein